MATTFLQVKNNATGKLAGTIALAATTVSLEAGQGALFPALLHCSHVPSDVVQGTAATVPFCPPCVPKPGAALPNPPRPWAFKGIHITMTGDSSHNTARTEER